MLSALASIEDKAKLAEMLEDAAVMAEFRHTAYWQVFEKLSLRHLDQLKARALAGNRDQFDYHKGLHDGAQALINLPEQIIRMAKESGRADR